MNIDGSGLPEILLTQSREPDMLMISWVSGEPGKWSFKAYKIKAGLLGLSYSSNSITS